MAGFEYNPLLPLNLQKRAKEVDPSQFATAEQGQLAESALQGITGTGDSYINISVLEPINNIQELEITANLIPIKDATSSSDGLASANNTRSYINSLIRKGLSATNTTDSNGIWRGPSAIWNQSSYRPYDVYAEIASGATYPYVDYILVAIPCLDITDRDRSHFFIYDVVNKIAVANMSVKVSMKGFDLSAY